MSTHSQNSVEEADTSMCIGQNFINNSHTIKVYNDLLHDIIVVTGYISSNKCSLLYRILSMYFLRYSYL